MGMNDVALLCEDGRVLGVLDLYVRKISSSHSR